jgi:hypothetical protein
LGKIISIWFLGGDGANISGSDGFDDPFGVATGEFGDFEDAHGDERIDDPLGLGGDIALAEDFAGGDAFAINLGVPFAIGLVVPLGVGVGNGKGEKEIEGEESGDEQLIGWGTGRCICFRRGAG